MAAAWVARALLLSCLAAHSGSANRPPPNDGGFHPAPAGWGQATAPPPALAPSLEFPHAARAASRPPTSTAGRATGERTVFVDCDHGSDGNDGSTQAAPLGTLAAAQAAARAARRASAQAQPEVAVAVEVRGSCHLHQPLLLTTADAGASLDAPTIWRGGGSAAAVISGGQPITDWKPVAWPGAPVGTVLQANISGWSAPIKTLRVGDEWVGRSRFPKADPANYSSG